MRATMRISREQLGQSSGSASHTLLISWRHLCEGIRRGLCSETSMISTAWPAALASSAALLSRRTVARDLDFLRNEDRAPPAYDDARHGFRLTDETYTLPQVRISRKDAFSFGLARKLLAHYEGTPLPLDMRSVLDKIICSAIWPSPENSQKKLVRGC